jgi:16S rRNA (guanine527-N7)-methyltransferase
MTHRVIPDEGGDVESPPSLVVDGFFGPHAEAAHAFAVQLATSAVERGLIGPRELPRLWSRHILNCAAVAPVLPAEATVVDVGSGAGLPGLVIAIARPDVVVTLVEPLLRRVTWLEEVTDTLQLPNVRVTRARAEELAPGVADVATARAVAPLEKLAGWCMPLVKPGGAMLAIKGRSAPEEVASAEDALRRLGGRSWRVLELGGDLLHEPTIVVEVRKQSGSATRGRPGARGGTGRPAARSAPRGSARRS